MTDDVYRRLATRVDEIPNGFPATESGVELRLLAKMFTPEEAQVASVMRLTPEPAAEIALRAGADQETGLGHLQAMADKGLIIVNRTEDEPAFSLMPFIVGFYEAWLTRMDEEYASLFEAYYQETRAGMLGESPSVHRVIPIELAIPFEVEIFPYERASALLERAKSWGVRDCICRVQKTLIGQACGHPVENCLIFAPVESAYEGSEDIRPLTKEEALGVLREAEEAGLVHSSGNYRRGNTYICNCCTCGCGVMRGIAEFGIQTAVARSAFRAIVEIETCIGCGTCLDRCQFAALSLSDGKAHIYPDVCAGCGLCVTTCPAEALHLERRPEDETSKPPATLRHWMKERAEARGITMEGIV
ncbi:MAG: 4Fe-4S dicluster domain-containing protein [Candidatus Bipolaricaulia bacterium]